MGLNKSKGNMYEFVTHTWNAIKGECPHGCTYCYMKRWGKQNPVRFAENELREFDRDIKKYGDGLFIFVGSTCDIYAEDIPQEWIEKTIDFCLDYSDKNKFLFQSKNPRRMGHELYRSDSFVICTTIETNRLYKDIMQDSPLPNVRATDMGKLYEFVRYVTIEPIMDFDLEPMVELIKRCEPEQVNIGADSMGHNLPEPSFDKVLLLIDELKKFTTISKKRNLSRLEPK